MAASVTSEPAQPDGLAALAVATAMLLGLVARDRGNGGQSMLTTMMNTAAHALSDDMVDYVGRAPVPSPDEDLHGLSASYRLYEASEGWVFLAAPSDREWQRFVAALGDAGAALPSRDDDAALVAALSGAFATGTAASWEKRLLAADVGCVSVRPGPVEAELQSDEFGRASGILVDVEHPTFGEHPRRRRPRAQHRAAHR
jgi:crotonobetainyl-CoA:carnitine CoA-transferase CaiB-like acyl-CoA transferase